MKNNKYYIFLIHCICNIAGMQLYVSRKIEYLQSQGWTPLVYYYTRGSAEIPNLKHFEDNCIPLLRRCVGNVSERNRQNVLAQIKQDIPNANEIIFETCCLALGTWGEYLASNLQCKHILYVIDEFISSPTQLMTDFIKFKIKQNLFFCIKPDVVTNHIIGIKNQSEITLRAVGSSSNNVIDYDNDKVKSIPEDSNTILYLGRLDKPYVDNLFHSIAKFSTIYANLKFNLVIVGDYPSKKSLQDLLNIFSKIKNIVLYNIGPLWPLPVELFRKATVALGSAGSINICNRQGVPSISIDLNDHEAIGILRINTQNTVYRDSDDLNESIVHWLKYVLVDKKVNRLTKIPDPPINYETHKSIIDMDYKKEYYPTHKSIHFTRNPLLRNLLIKFDQTNFGHKLISRYRSALFVKKIIRKFNN